MADPQAKVTVGFRIDPRASFFDRQKVTDMMDAKTHSSLSRFGAFVRTRAISLILGHRIHKGFGIKTTVKGTEGTSEPGTPPFSHTGDVVKRIEFAYDAAKKTVVIGPTLFRKGTVEKLEHGGPVQIQMHNGRLVMAYIRPRPFMRPAFDAELVNAAPNFRER